MRERWKLFCLFTRWSVYRILVVLGLVVAAEMTVFYLALGRALTEPGVETALWQILEASEVKKISLLGFFMVTLLLLRAGRDYSGKSEYTFLRLGVSCRTVFFCQAAFNTCAYLLFWMVQMFVALGMSLWYLKVAEPSWITNQTLFLQIYRSDFLFSLLPLEAGGIWARNGMICLTLGIAAAHEPFCQRRKKISVAVYIVAALSFALFFQNIIDESEYILWIVNVLVAGMTILHVYLEEDKLCLN